MAVFSTRDVTHPFDEFARRGLALIPELDAAVSRCGEAEPRPAGWESLSPDHRPEIYRLLPPIAASFGIDCPELLLAVGSADTCTLGGDHPTIVLFAGLVDRLRTAELEAALARECGHIMLGNIALRTVARRMVADLPIAARVALAGWVAKSELSADRAAAAYLGNPDAVTGLMFQVAGLPPDAGTIHSEPVRGEVAPPSAVDREPDRPALLAVRVREIQAWAATAGFARLAMALGQRVPRVATPARVVGGPGLL